MSGPYSPLPKPLALGLLTGIGYPLVDLAVACRQPVAEACVWCKAHLPLTLGSSLLLVGGVVSLLAYAVLSKKRPSKQEDANR